MKLKRRLAGGLLAVCSGLLVCGCLAFERAWPVTFVCLVPLLFALERASVRQAAALGWTCGAVYSAAGLYWLFPTLRTHAGLSTTACVAAFGALIVFEAVRMALACWLSAKASSRGWPAHASFTGAVVSAEVLFPLVFPWNLGAALHPATTLIQIADITGPVGLTLVVVLVNVAMARTVRGIASLQPSLRPMVPALWLLAICGVYGSVRVAMIEALAARSPAFKVGLVQGGVPDGLGVKQRAESLARYVARTNDLAQAGAELVVWPESSFAFTVAASSINDSVRDVFGDKLAVPLVMGAVVEQGGARYNSALSIDRAATVVGRYDKQRLLPFSEYLPMGSVLPALYRLSPRSSRFEAGTWARPLPVEDKRVAAMICYEALDSPLINQSVRETQPHLLVNLTNDAWFGPTLEPRMHLALSKLRAVEHRRFLVRATTTGLTAVVAPTGRVQKQAPPFEPSTLLTTVHWVDVSTPYQWLGSVPWYLMALAMLVAATVKRQSCGRWLGRLLAAHAQHR